MAEDPSLITAAGSYTGDPASYTLADWVRYAKATEAEASAVKTMYDVEDVMGDIPMQTRKVFEMKVKRFTGKSKPRVDHMPLNQDPRAVKAVPEDYLEKVSFIRNLIDADKAILEAEGRIVDLQGNTEDMYMTSMAFKNNDYFINNTHGTGPLVDVLAPVGIKARLYDTANPVPADMIVNANVDISAGNLAALSGNALLMTFYFDTLLSNMSNKTGAGCVAYMNALMKNAFGMSLKAINAGGGYSITKDNYDRPVDNYKSVKFTDLGRKVDETSPVIGFENADGTPNANGNYTSIYVVRFGPKNFRGWHWHLPLWENLGRMPNGITMRQFFEYPYGFMNDGLRNIGRIYGIKVRNLP